MKLWLISQEENNGYDTFDSAVVAAETEEEAKQIIPGHNEIFATPPHWGDPNNGWAWSPENVQATCIGTAIEGTQPGTILASFNAG